MAELGGLYATLVELKAELAQINNTNLDAGLTRALTTASRGIDKYCGRQFNRAETATPRVFKASAPGHVAVDDFWDTATLVVGADDAGDGGFATTWAAADIQLEPLNGVVDGEPGWPYSDIQALTGAFPCDGKRAAVRVTAKWGWEAVPPTINQACLIVAVEVYKTKDAPFGVAGFDNYGVVRVRNNPMVVAKLAPYRRHAVLVG